ncbi:MAG: M1 family metallopeptidase, partial [Candidatus Sericytochromatia bacterium]|nr:M1 family metallopeptidase [Candidatus Tanganyikabacteria bacterium]
MVSMVTYDIQARLDPATHEVSGYEEVVFANPTDRPLPEIVFQLYPNNFRPGSLYLRQVERQLNVDAFFPKGRDPGWLRVDEAAVDGVPAAFTESEAAGTVALAQPLPPGATASIRLRFATRVPEAFDRFGRFEDSYSLAYWYPRLGVPTPTGWDAPARRTVFQEFHDLRSNFRVRLDVPIGYTVGATGKRVDVAHLPGERKAYTFEARNVNSFAAIADPGLDETVHDAHGVRIHVLTRPDEQRLIQPLVEQSADLLKFFGDLVGPYPYEDLTIVSSLTVPGFGVELPQVVLLDRGNATLNNYLGWLGEFGLLGLNAHEIGHQWFFGILGSDEAASPWLDEGFTSYITQRWLESPRSGAEGRQFYFKGPFDLFNGLHLVPTDREDAYRYSVVEDGQDLAVPLTTGTDGIAAGQFGMWYKRGTAVINMLRLV